MTQFVSHKVAEEHSLAQAATVGELLGIVRENVGDGGKAPVVWIKCEAKAILSVPQPIRHGPRKDAHRQSRWPRKNLTGGKLTGLFGRQRAIQPLDFDAAVLIKPRGLRFGLSEDVWRDRSI